jgi:polyphosphate kinase
MLLEDVIRYCLRDVFSIFKFDRFEPYTIKLTRDAELDIDNDLSKSFLDKISQGVWARKKGQPVRFIYDKQIPEDLLSFIINRLELDEADNLIPGGRYHNFKDFMTFPNIGGDHLVYPKLKTVNHPRLKPNKSIIDEVAISDFFLHYPYHNFNQYINLLREAAIDPHVVSIKITLYRVAEVSRVIMALINAARNGKEVTVIFELQARFNEESNIRWSKKLQEVGAHVIFGVPGLKIHAKLTLISRREKRRLVHYACVGTGNFHEGNAAVYVDCSLFTIDPRITIEVRKVFDFFEHPFRSFSYKHLIVSPLYMRRRCNHLVENEIKNALAGKEASIILKLNSIVDTELINKLYRASNAGVKIKLIVRGICSLIPGIPWLSENIEVISIVGRFLEHSRFMVFHNNGDELYYLSSADWMIRNMDHRVEVACPVYDPKLQQEIKKIINLHLSDNVKARIVNREQDNVYRKTRSKKQIDSQQEIYRKISQHLLR